MNLSLKSYGIKISAVTKNKTMICSLRGFDPEISEDPNLTPGILLKGQTVLKGGTFLLKIGAINPVTTKLTLEFQTLVEPLVRKVTFL